jgi:predicted glycoside hydrolase/deacetylase ChbG (UPF0249 family)
MKHGISRPSSANRLLGYPDDARLLIVNADDFGMCHGVNQAIVAALDAGIVRSTSLMVPCAWHTHAAQFLAHHGEVSFAVHLTAVGDGAVYRWGPVTAAEKVPSLVDGASGSRFFFTFDQMVERLAHLDLAELETEFRAQLETVLAAGLHPTHLDWHSLRIANRLDIFDVLFRLAREYGLALRVAWQPWREALQGSGLPALDHDLVDSYALDATTKAEHFIRMLRELPEGLSEWAAHPGLDTPELLAIEPGHERKRQADYDFFTSQAAKAVIRAEGIMVIDYRPLQAVWNANARR